MPIATEHLLYVHMPKTGGMWVSHVLKQAGGIKVPNTRRHSPAGDVPASWAEGRTMFGTIRDPWSWYISLWNHLRVGRDGKMLLRALGNGDQKFPAFVRGATDPSIWCNIPQVLTEGWWDWPMGADGLYSETFRAVYGHDTLVPQALIDQAQLGAGLSELLGMDVSAIPRQNSSKDRAPTVSMEDPTTLYDPETEALVREYDGTLAQRIGYTEPFQELPKPIRWGELSD